MENIECHLGAQLQGGRITKITMTLFVVIKKRWQKISATRSLALTGFYLRVKLVISTSLKNGQRIFENSKLGYFVLLTFLMHRTQNSFILLRDWAVPVLNSIDFDKVASYSSALLDQ